MLSARSILAVLVGAAAAVAIVFFVVRGQRLPEGPVEVAWDREACAECRMHVGDPRYAVQLQTNDGQVLDFDDVGCFFTYAARTSPDAHATFFHDSETDSWLTPSQARFIPGGETPMGYGLRAIAHDAPGSLTLDQARQAALSRH